MGKKIVWRAVVLLCLCHFSVSDNIAGDFDQAEDVDVIFQQLTVSERIGQLIDLRIVPTKENVEAIMNTIHEFNIGSVTIAGGDPEAIALLIARMKRTMKVPLFVTVEQRQLSGLPFGAPSALPLTTTFHAAADENLFRSAIDRLAELFYSTDIDAVAYNPLSLAISDNGFSAVSEASSSGRSYTESFSSILAKHNLASTVSLRFQYGADPLFSPRSLDATYKSPTPDVKAALAALNHPLSILQIVDFPAFSESEATLFQKKVMTPLLWKEWQFSGIIAADLDRIAAARFVHPRMTDIRTLLKSGVDKIIVSADPGMVQLAILGGLSNRYFRQNEITEKVRRILHLKASAGRPGEATTEPMNYAAFSTDKQLNKIAYKVYMAAAQIQETSNPFLPVLSLENVNFAALTIGQSTHRGFQESLEKYTSFVHFNIPGLTLDETRLEELENRLAGFDYVFVALFPNGLLAYDPSILRFLNQLNRTTRVVIVFFGSEPGGVSGFEEFSHRLIMHEDCESTQKIAAQVVFGAVGTRHSLQRLGFSTPEWQGMDPSVLAKIDDIAREAISIGATPGMQVLIVRNGEVVMERAYGHTTYDSLVAVDASTIYDLASVTKVMATTPAMMKLYEHGLVSLDYTLGDYLTEMDTTDKAKLKIRDVLAHRSGLRSFYPFWKFTVRDEELWNYYYRTVPNELADNSVAEGMYATTQLTDSLWRWAIEMKLRPKRNTREQYNYRYSDLGFYILQHVVERLSGTNLNVLMDSLFYRPLGMASSGFNPLRRFPQNTIAPTELDKEFRKTLIWGTVHDQMAAMNCGVGGHAGLFGNAYDAAKFMQMMLQGGNYGGKTYFAPETINLFTSAASQDSRRGLGWDKPEKGSGEHPASRYASFESFGHTGFTGTLVWADPTFNLVFVFLSNRVYPDATNNKLTTFNIRKRMHDIVYESIWSFEKQSL